MTELANSEDQYDYVIIGGGIAGLASAELFQRNGYSVLLIEKNDILCQEASASQAGWFHFGSLYCMFPQPQFLRTLVGGVEDLIDYYSSAPGMNIHVGEDGSLSFPDVPGKWFRDEPLEYMVAARNSPDFDLTRFESLGRYLKKLFFVGTWELAIKQFISRHVRFHKHDWRGRGDKSAAVGIPKAGWSDYSRAVIEKPMNLKSTLDPDSHFVVKGFDRPMNVDAILGDLLGSYLAHGGRVMTGVEAKLSVEKADQGKIIVAGEARIHARHVIIASGRWTGDIAGPQADAKVVVSPILVVYPAVDDRNFVRMTPFVDKTLNHIHHEAKGRRYSVIGGGYSANPNDPIAVDTAIAELRAMALTVYPDIGSAEIVGTYMGFKTEIPSKSGERNYQYIIRPIDDDMTVVVPGKFSLGFSLAVNLFEKLTGKKPTGTMKVGNDDGAVGKMLGMTRHAAIACGMEPS